MEDFTFDVPDEGQIIEFIRSHAEKKYGSEFLRGFSDDDITYIIDIAYDYYADKGLLDLDADDNDLIVEIDQDELIDFVEDELKKEKELKATREQIEAIVLLESECIDEMATFDE